MGLLELLHLSDAGNKVEEEQKISVKGDNNKLTIVEQHLTNQQQIELGLEIIIILAVLFIIYFVGAKVYRCYTKTSKNKKERKMQRLRQVLSTSEV